MARKDCKMERNMRIYHAYTKGVSISSLSKMVSLTPERIRQIIHTTEHYLSLGEPDYIAAYRLGN